MNKKRIISVIIMALCFVFCGGCDNSASNGTYIRKSTQNYFNSVFSVTVYSGSGESDEIDSLFSGQMKEVAAEVERLMSIMSEEGDIYRFNHAQYGERVEITRLTADILKVALEIYRKTDGAYNPAVAALVDLWGFSPRFIDVRYAEEEAQPYDRESVMGEYSSLPQEEYIESFKKLTDLSGLEIEEVDGRYYITKNCPSVVVADGETEKVYSQQLDFGGIAKGYVADRCGEILRENGFAYGMTSLGSSSLSLLSFYDTELNKEKSWKVSVSSPDTRQSAFVYEEANCGVSTSGVYENYYTIGGKEYSHIIDASLGAPIDNGIKSITLSGVGALEGDAYTTALCVMGAEKAMQFVKDNLPDCKVVILVEDGEKFKAYTNIPQGKYTFERQIISEVINF